MCKQDVIFMFDQEWRNAEIYCPFCGIENVIEEKGPGDYYLGPESRCLNETCKASFTFQGGMEYEEPNK